MTETRTEWQQERRRAREAALQMLYECEVGQLSAGEAVAAYAEIEQSIQVAPGEAADFAVGLVEGTIGDLASIDPIIEASSEHWRLARMSVVDRAVLRMAVYQFLHAPDIPHRRRHRRIGGARAPVRRRGVEPLRQRRARRHPPKARCGEAWSLIPVSA